MDDSERKIQNLRRRLAELGSTVRQLNQSGLDNATAQLLLSRKRAELEDLIKRGRSDAVRSAQMVRPQRG
jgi:cell division septum initiation protein DivIVA